ncbi:MAG: OmpA family protein [Rubricella sp.]
MKTTSSIALAAAAFALVACGQTMDDDGMAMNDGMASEYTVYFGFDRSDLSAQAAEVVATASDAAVSGGADGVSLVGHTDTSGPAAYNQALSERRAATVRSAMVADGVDNSIITASGRGENDLAVDTADGVREPWNRRVEITLSGLMAAAPMMEEPTGANCVIVARTGECEQTDDGVTLDP